MERILFFIFLFVTGCQQTNDSETISSAWDDVLRSDSAESEKANLIKVTDYFKKNRAVINIRVHLKSGAVKRFSELESLSETKYVSVSVEANEESIQLDLWEPKLEENIYVLVQE